MISSTLLFLRPSISKGLFSATRQLRITLNHRPHSVSLPHTTVGCMSSNTPTIKCDEKIPDIDSPTDWVTIYKFDQIRIAKILCRAKIYQTFITGVCVSSSTYAYLVGSSSFVPFIQASGICAFACVMLYIFGNIFNKLIGFAYVSHDKKWIKLSHLTFWGGRSNIKVPMEVLKPLPSDSSAKLYQVMYLQTDPKFRLIIPLVHCTIYDPQLFELSFKIDLDLLK